MTKMETFVFLFLIALSGASPIINAGSNRISNALTAEENQFPYTISLQQLSGIQSDTRGHRCGGALITFQHALTAASCTFNDNNGVFSPINPAEYRVFAGSVVLTNDTSADRLRSIEHIEVHPAFEMSRPFVYDIAVIMLFSPFSEDAVKPLKLLSQDPFFPMPQDCTVAGWGAQDRSASASTQLMYLWKSMYSQTLCAQLYSNLHQVTIQSEMICATSGQMPPSGCAGDYGNPLVCFSRSSNDEYLTGLLTITNGCAASESPEVYTRVSSYYSWVHHIINNLPPAPGGASTFQPGLAMLAILALMQLMS